jgi:hypothetical protein
MPAWPALAGRPCLRTECAGESGRHRHRVERRQGGRVPRGRRPARPGRRGRPVAPSRPGPGRDRRRRRLDGRGRRRAPCHRQPARQARPAHRARGLRVGPGGLSRAGERVGSRAVPADRGRPSPGDRGGGHPAALHHPLDPGLRPRPRSHGSDEPHPVVGGAGTADDVTGALVPRLARAGVAAPDRPPRGRPRARVRVPDLRSRVAGVVARPDRRARHRPARPAGGGSVGHAARAGPAADRRRDGPAAPVHARRRKLGRLVRGRRRRGGRGGRRPAGGRDLGVGGGTAVPATAPRGGGGPPRADAPAEHAGMGAVGAEPERHERPGLGARRQRHPAVTARGLAGLGRPGSVPGPGRPRPARPARCSA